MKIKFIPAAISYFFIVFAFYYFIIANNASILDAFILDSPFMVFMKLPIWLSLITGLLKHSSLILYGVVLYSLFLLSFFKLLLKFLINFGFNILTLIQNVLIYFSLLPSIYIILTISLHISL